MEKLLLLVHIYLEDLTWPYLFLPFVLKFLKIIFNNYTDVLQLLYFDNTWIISAFANNFPSSGIDIKWG